MKEVIQCFNGHDILLSGFGSGTAVAVLPFEPAFQSLVPSCSEKKMAVMQLFFIMVVMTPEAHVGFSTSIQLETLK
jgi:hypothetical protein